jgi:2-dehydro-3-deoxygluconokinase
VSFDVVTFGETMVLFVRDRASGHYLVDYVGAESNVAVGLARLGHRARWISRLGADEFGDYIVDQLTREGVDAAVERDARRHTGLMVKELRDGATRVLYYRRDSACAGIETPPQAALLDDARWLHLTGVTPALSDGCRQAFLHQLDVAANRGIKVSFDVNYRPVLWPDEESARQELLSVARRADLVFAGRDEAEFLTGHATAEGFADALGLSNGRQLVLKLGADGAEFLDAKQRVFERAIPSEVVDVTGAGDAFAAGYLAGLLRGAPVDARLRLGHLVASRAIQVTGDVGVALTEDEVTAVTATEELS